MYLEVEICAIDDKPKEQSEFYKILYEVDPKAAIETLYSVDIPLGKDDT